MIPFQSYTKYYNNNQRNSLIALNGEAANRQALLNLVLSWIIDSDKAKYPEIKNYMSIHRFDENANELIEYYKSVIDWVHSVFGENTYYGEMRGLPWGILYNQYHNNKYDTNVIQQQVADLMCDEEVQSKKGIFEYVFDNKRKHLSLRAFDNNIKRTVYQKQGGICPDCKNTANADKVWNFEEMEGDHIIPWSQGGKTVLENCQMLCQHHNRIKSDD